ncbi:hypothetical protein SCLCIDRAFT_145140, partial [Scleroderma citrinum Foug A]
PSCMMPGDDCPLVWGEYGHIFCIHCLLKWVGTTAYKQQFSMDRRPWCTCVCPPHHRLRDTQGWELLSQILSNEKSVT